MQPDKAERSDRNNQVDTECTEFRRSFTEKRFMRFAQVAWNNPRLAAPTSASWPALCLL